VELDLAPTLAVKLAVDPLQVEDGLGIAVGLQDLLVHLLVAAGVTGRGRRQVEDDLAGGLAGGDVQLDLARRHLERALDRVQGGPEAEGDLGGWESRSKVRVCASATPEVPAKTKTRAKRRTDVRSLHMVGSPIRKQHPKVRRRFGKP
jgi:hypothetical protein